jgi:HlyD family secretion protein
MSSHTLNARSCTTYVVLIASVLNGCAPRAAKTGQSVPAAIVERGDLQIVVFARGLLKATHTLPVNAPAIGGGTLQIIAMPKSGAAVSAQQMVLEFDASQQQYNLEQSQNEMAQADEEIRKSDAEGKVQAAEDQTALLKARFAVRRAELDVSKNEILSDIDGAKNRLALDEARRALSQLEEDVRSHSLANKAAMSLSREKHTKASLAVNQARMNIARMQIKSPASGILVVHGNIRATGGIFFEGMQLPDYQPGDQVQPGAPIAEVVDPSEIEVEAQIEERDRPLLREGQSAKLAIDSFPGEAFDGTVLNISAAANQQFFDFGTQANFGAIIRVLHPDQRLRPGFTADIRVFPEKLLGVTWVPLQAVFEKGDKSIVYIRSAGDWRAQDIRVRAHAEGRVVVEGITSGSEVALADPTSMPVAAVSAGSSAEQPPTK